MESEELPPQTTMCELSTTNEYQGENTLGLLLPSVSRSHNIMRDTTETDQVTTLSNCRESAAPPSRRGPDAALGLPERIPFELALATPIDTASAAAGDVISARLTGPLLGPSGKVLAPTGATATGRIVRMEHQLGARNYFLVSMAFDTLQVAGVELRLYARSDGNGKAMLSRQGHEDWPTGTFLFPGSNPQYVISAGYKSKWRTTAPTPTK
jgi:hypothetical protein